MNNPFIFNMATFAIFPAFLTLNLSKAKSKDEQIDYLYDFADDPNTSKDISLKALKLIQKMNNKV